MTNDAYETIITGKFVFGKTAEKLAKEVGCGKTTVGNTIAVFKCVRDEDWKRCEELISKQKFPLAPFIWAARRLEKELPQSLYDAYDSIRTEVNKENSAKKAEKATKEEEPKADNTNLFLVKVLEALIKQNELLEQLCDTVIPHWTNDVKDNINANTDIICNRLNEAIKISECIKQNTRRKGA